MTLYAIDGGDPPRTGSIQVDIAVVDANDNRPEFEQPVYEVRVPESTPVGSVLVQVRAGDILVTKIQNFRSLFYENMNSRIFRLQKKTETEKNNNHGKRNKMFPA